MHSRVVLLACLIGLASGMVFNQRPGPATTPVPTDAPTGSPTRRGVTPAATDAPTDAPADSPTGSRATPAPTEPTPSPTPEPTKEGVPCPCLETACFDGYDTNKNGVIEGFECAKAPKLGMDNCSSIEWDQDQDRNINATEWHYIFENFSDTICPTPEEKDGDTCCNGGYYFASAGTCSECRGEVRRRRAVTCTDCPSGKFDAGFYDECIGQRVYLLHETFSGNASFLVSDVRELVVGYEITIRDEPDNASCEGNPIPVEKKNITSIDDVWVNGYLKSQVTVDTPLNWAFHKYSTISVSCTHTTGTDYSLAYINGECGCGTEICGKYECCDAKLNNGTGGCGDCGSHPTHPTPSPTVGAKGDPHLVNLAGEHFDINHGGEFTLLRIPQSPELPAEFQLQATITSEYGKPCTTYITKVQFNGSWLGGNAVHARSYLRSRDANLPDAQLGVRFVDVVGDTSWENIDTALPEDEVLSTPDQDVEVIIAKSQWSPRKRVKEGAPNLAGVFTLTLRHKKSPDAAKITIRQDLPDQEHLNLAVRKISALGRVDVGGLLGFDNHPDWLETVSAECSHHRATEKYRIGSQDGEDEEPLYERPKWMHKWDRIKEQRARRAELGEDNDVVASSLMCKCSASWDAESDTEAEGVLVEEQVARMADAAWD